MKIISRQIILLLIAMFSLNACKKDDISPASRYDNVLSFSDNSENHPKNSAFQSIIDSYVNQGVIGTSVMIKNAAGTWLGAGGSADLASKVPLKVSHQFLIA
ncbi:MAG TPA: hypothetical protein ENJ82_09265, partial [Bacteroidetes bacterium]|nr:hypothetical protein [Bacteroidota bacterium]